MAKQNVKCDISENWAKATFIPKEGEIIVYSDLGKIKRGDGVSRIGELAFEQDTTTAAYDGIYFIRKED